MELGISGLVQTIGIDEEGGAWCERRLLLRINESHAAGANAASRTFVKSSSASLWTDNTEIVPQSGTPSWTVTTE